VSIRDKCERSERSNPRLLLIASRYRARYFQDATFEALALIEPVAKKHNLTLLEVALRWCVHHSKLQMVDGTKRDGVIIGVSSLKQLEGNLTDLEKGPLPDEVVQTLDEAWNVCKASAPTYWR
jgi:aflatoxin B1 aldehyde reductase